MIDNLKLIEAMHTVIENFRVLSREDRDYLLLKLTKENEVLPNDIDPYADIRKDYLNRAIDLIPAIKMVRERSMQCGLTQALGLKEAKDLVETWRR